MLYEFVPFQVKNSSFSPSTAVLPVNDGPRAFEIISPTGVIFSVLVNDLLVTGGSLVSFS